MPEEKKIINKTLSETVPNLTLRDMGGRPTDNNNNKATARGSRTKGKIQERIKEPWRSSRKWQRQCAAKSERRKKGIQPATGQRTQARTY